MRSRERSRERSTLPLRRLRRDEGCWCPRPFLGQSRFGRSQKRPRKVKFLSFFFFFFYCHLGKEKLAYLRCDFFRQRRREHERAPPLKKLKITRALRSNEETRDSRSNYYLFESGFLRVRDTRPTRRAMVDLKRAFAGTPVTFAKIPAILQSLSRCSIRSCRFRCVFRETSLKIMVYSPSV